MSFVELLIHWLAEAEVISALDKAKRGQIPLKLTVGSVQTHTRDKGRPDLTEMQDRDGAHQLSLGWAEVLIPAPDFGLVDVVKRCHERLSCCAQRSEKLPSILASTPNAEPTRPRRCHKYLPLKC